MIAEIALAGSNWFPCMEPTWLHYFITAVHRWSVQYKMKMSSLVFAPQGFCTPKCVMCPSWTMCVPRVVCSSLAPGSRITWLGSIDLQARCRHFGPVLDSDKWHFNAFGLVAVELGPPVGDVFATCMRLLHRPVAA